MEITKTHNKQSGFTLVELAIVMIIIGLLIGGILKGQELIANSQVTATIAQVKGIDAAVSTFRDKYASLPGDIVTAGRLPNCAAAPCAKAAAANGRIGGTTVNTAGGAPGLGVEGTQAFIHLAVAELLSGIDTSAAILAFGSALPEAKVGGGFTGIEYSTGNAFSTSNNAVPGHYLSMTGVVAALAAGTGSLQAARGAQMDRKLDDGDADNGSVRGSTTDGCSAAGVYAEANSGSRCSMFFRVQG